MKFQDDKSRPIKVTFENPSTISGNIRFRMQRSLLIFENSIRSPVTRIEYKYQLQMFLEFTGIKDHDSLAALDPEKIQSLLEDYILDMKVRGLKSITIKNYLSGPKLFFDMNRKLYHRKILAKMIPEMQKEGNESPYTDDDIKKMLAASRFSRTRALIHFFASTGARPNVLEDPVLRFKHLHDMPMGCKAVLLYEGSREEYWAFLTPQAVKALEEYTDERKMRGESITPESPVFGNRVLKISRRGHLSTSTARELLSHLVKKAGIERSKRGERYDKASIYGFRKRFNTILKTNNNVNYNIAEKLMAHKNGLDGVYLKPTREQCFAEFAKAIPELTIHSSNVHDKDQTQQITSAN